MERALNDAVAEFSILLLVAAFVLIGVSLLGLGGTLALAAVLALVTGGLLAASDSLVAAVPDYHLLARALGDLWIGTAAATVTVVLALGATAGELQTLGGLIGLVGMLNYVLRPVYRLCYALGRRVASAANG